MPTFTLTDVSHDVWVETLTVDAEEMGLAVTAPWSVTKRRLQGGRRDGVDLIVVDNGSLRFSIVPTRGMGLWKGFFQGNFLGWESPITDGPVHPALVNLATPGGLGWLDGFDELMARCGLENNGAPFVIEGADGSGNRMAFGLHGRIANIPASYVAVHVDPDPPHEIMVEGHVEEGRLFGPQLRLTTRYRTTPGSNRLTVYDEITNLKDQPTEFQLLYHWNFGPPFLDDGARFAAPIRSMAPRDARAQEDVDQHDRYRAPQPGYAEQVYFYDLAAESEGGPTLAMLRNAHGDKGVVLRFRKDQLPAFTLWKNTAGLRDGYVTGLEPGTNYPNPRPVEAARGRVVTLPPGAHYAAETVLEVLATPGEVQAVEGEIRRIQSGVQPTIHRQPTEPFCP
jgi:galactose mutarotase-like enzyme